MRLRKSWVKVTILGFLVLGVSLYFTKTYRENRMLKQVILRLCADSRIAQVLVTEVKADPVSNLNYTTIKFLEYDSNLKPLKPKYFTFSGNIIQFQSLVIRFNDFLVKKGHPLKGKSAYLFWRVFAIVGDKLETYNIARINEIPAGYEVQAAKSSFEKELWRNFWDYALKENKADRIGIKNAQIEAPGTKFIPGMLYTIKIEHDGGMRIDSEKLPGILNGEKIDF